MSSQQYAQMAHISTGDHARLVGAHGKDPTHQHPQPTPPEVTDTALASKDTVISVAWVTPALARRDATKCLSDGTCADGRYASRLTQRDLQLLLRVMTAAN
jgi:hypothetical protein